MLNYSLYYEQKNVITIISKVCDMPAAPVMISHSCLNIVTLKIII